MVTAARCYVTGTYSFMGLCPAGTNTSVVVVGLHSGLHPFVLRPFENKYNFIGPCYLNGLPEVIDTIRQEAVVKSKSSLPRFALDWDSLAYTVSDE